MLTAPDADLYRLGARAHELACVRRSVSVAVAIDVTREGYVHQHVGGRSVLPHGFLPDMADAPEAPAVVRALAALADPEPYDPRDFVCEVAAAAPSKPAPPREVASVAPDAPPEIVCVVDTETTGLVREGGRITEIACVRASLATRRIVGVWPTRAEPGQLLDPGVPVPGHITRLTGITSKMLAGQPTFASVWPSLAGFVGDAPVVAHNAGFDRAMFEAELERMGLFGPEWPRWRWHCSQAIAKRVVPGLPSYSLSGRDGGQGLRHFLSLGTETAHRAHGDVLTTCKLLAVLRERAGGPWATWCGVPHVWGVGKGAAAKPVLRGLV